MTGHDDLMDDLMDSVRRARPDERVSARTPAAQALLEEILSMDTIHASQADADHVVDLTAVRGRRTGRGWLAVGGAVAAGVAALVAAVAVVVNPADRSEAAAIDAALARSATSLDRSGRAQVEWRVVHGNEEPTFVDNGVDVWEYADDDWSVRLQYWTEAIPSDLPDSTPSDVAPINRYVDGELYLYIADRGGRYRWFHDVTGDASTQNALQVNPQTLLDELDPAGDFDEVGDDTTDGVHTRRLRATNPSGTELPPLGAPATGYAGEVSGLAVWVDDDGFVRRLDLTFAGTHNVFEASASIRFYDFGEPIAIEAPPDPEAIDPAG